MINARRFAIVCFSASFFALLLGCASTSTYKPTPPVYKDVQIVSEPTGARIEINGDYIGDAPLIAKVRIDEGGRFYSNTIIRAYPKGNGYVQTRSFLYGFGTSESLNCPDRIFLDTNLHYTYPQIPMQIQ